MCCFIWIKFSIYFPYTAELALLIGVKMPDLQRKYQILGAKIDPLFVSFIAFLLTNSFKKWKNCLLFLQQENKIFKISPV